ncbi:related to alcohol dehydrogenase homolog Bli-4 [Cephalotrichum gorgonifer]|uniref:Related to alcohol dehydrogenase homolog Bli-4 n=1 Tax=Cephalotrichum gorgonifer TaxID=2041049 RepID=A0AAE8MU50_9PEZI|nr:related to alcohol dehydrogenase homolog Bli-4 [Cephalotrichum gorgonifer]
MLFSKSAVPFDQEKDIPPLDGKVILVTGCTNGLGKQSVLEYCRHSPKEVWLAARDPERARVAADEIRAQVPGAPIKLLEVDLESFDSIKAAAKKFMEESVRLDILLLNAGIMAPPPGLTRDGYEVQFGTNHMGHALLTKLLLPVLEKTAALPGADVRVVAVASYGHNRVPKEGILFDTLKTPAADIGPYQRYGQSKLANLLFIRQLAKEYPQFTAAVVHPGLVKTNLAGAATGSGFLISALWKVMQYSLTTVEDGVRNQLWASISKDVKSGEYYEPVGVAGKASVHGRNDEFAKRVWDWTEEELVKHGA